MVFLQFIPRGTVIIHLNSTTPCIRFLKDSYVVVFQNAFYSITMFADKQILNVAFMARLTPSWPVICKLLIAYFASKQNIATNYQLTTSRFRNVAEF